MPRDLSPMVLCVEDDEDSREMLSLLLKHWRIETKTVGTATQALSMIQAERFDLYLLDTQLPDLDGFELCRRMRSLDPQTPILFFSGDAYESDKQKGIEAGASASTADLTFLGNLRRLRRRVLSEINHVALVAS